MASTSWLVEVADIFLSATTFHGHLWLLNELLEEALSALITSFLLRGENSDKAGIFDEALQLLRRVRLLVPDERLRDQRGRRGLFLVSWELFPGDQRLLLMGGLDIRTLAYGEGVHASTRVPNPEVKMCREGPGLFFELGDAAPPGECPSHTGGGSSNWGSGRILCDPPRPTGADAPRAGAGAAAGHHATALAWRGRGGVTARAPPGHGHAGHDPG